jgi:hypothetical protein
MPYPTVRVYVDLSATGLAAATTWTEITSFVCHDTLSFSYGRSRGVDEVQPGSGSFALINVDGRFDPSYTAGPYGSNFRLRRRVKVEAVLNSTTYSVAYGWIESITQRWNHRAEQIAEVRFTDALGALARHELPESVWDHRIAARSGKVAWFKLGSDTTSTAVDYSGLRANGRYVTYEGVNSPYGASATPKQVIQAGVTDPVMQQVDRPGRSFSAMIAEADQPLGGVALNENWRTTAIVCDQTSAALITPTQDATFEMWVTLRPAFPLDSQNLKSGNAIETCLLQWGDAINLGGGASPEGPMVRLGFTDAGQLRLSRYAGGFIQSSIVGATALPSGEPVHIVFRKSGTSLTLYVNGQLNGGTLGLPSSNIPWGFPLVLGYATGYSSGVSGHMAGNWSTWGDVVLYNRALSATEIVENYQAGRWGNLTFSGVTTAGEAVSQALTIAGYGLTISAVETTGHVVEPGPLNRRSVLDYIREVSTSEGALWWFGPGGTLTWWANDWSVRKAVSTTDQFLFTDDNTTFGGLEVGHAGDVRLTFDDSVLVNDCTVTWRGGEVRSENSTSITAYGRSRKSVSTLLANSGDAQDRADWETWRRGTPLPEISEITVEPNDDTSWLSVLSIDLGYRVRVIATRPNGTKLDADYWIESINYAFAMGQDVCQVRFGLAPADTPAAPFILNTSTLNSSAVLWY